MKGIQGFQKGKDNPNFGKIKEKPTLSALHAYMRKRVPKTKICSICKLNKKLELSSKNHSYTRDIKDWWWLCKRCHFNYDGADKYLELGRYRKGKWIKKKCLTCKIEINVPICNKVRKKFCSRKCLMLNMWKTGRINHI